MIETETLDGMPKKYHEDYLNQKMGFDDWLGECSDEVRLEAMDAGIGAKINAPRGCQFRPLSAIASWRVLELRYNEYLEGGVL